MQQAWIDFESIKRRVSMSAVLEHYGISGLKASGKSHLRGRCPLHGGESSQTFHVDTTQQVFHCFSCHAGGSVIDLVMAIESCGMRQAAAQILRWHQLPASCQEQRLNTAKQTVTKKRECIPELGFRLRDVDPRHPYLRSREINEATAVEFGVGYYPGPGLMHERIVIPIYNELGRLVGYSGRALDGSEPRYRFPPRFPKSRLVFNLHRAAATQRADVIVVEGFFDCLNVWQAGFHSVIAVMGSCIYEEQCRLLIESFRYIRLMFDGDVAGRRGARTAAHLLARHRAVEIVELPDGVQPDHLGPHSLRDILGTRRPIPTQN